METRAPKVAQGVEKLVVEDAVEDEVEGQVAVDEQIGDDAQKAIEGSVRELLHRLISTEQCLGHRSIGERRWNDADEEEADDADARDRQPDLLRRMTRDVPAAVTSASCCSASSAAFLRSASGGRGAQLCASAIGLEDDGDETGVQVHQQETWNEVQNGDVQPREEPVEVARLELRRPALVGPFVGPRHGRAEEPRQVNDERDDDGGNDRSSSQAPSTDLLCLQRVAHRDVPLEGHYDRYPDARVRENVGDRVEDVGIVELPEEDALAEGLREGAFHQRQSQYHDVCYCQCEQVRVRGTLHAAPCQYDRVEGVTCNPKDADDWNDVASADALRCVQNPRTGRG